MKYTIGEKCFGLAPKLGHAVDGIDPRRLGRKYHKDGDTWKQPCSCGRGSVIYQYVKRHDTWVSLYKVWTESYNFGEPDFADCCCICEENQRREAEKESEA